MQVKYIAHDGSEFGDESLCRAYEHLIEATKDHKFKTLVKGLFDGLKSYEDDGYGSRTDEVFRLTGIDKFTANLVKALPALGKELERALIETSPKS
jgi:hypothetical protein